jgi:hypothetical protein
MKGVEIGLTVLVIILIPCMGKAILASFQGQVGRRGDQIDLSLVTDHEEVGDLLDDEPNQIILADLETHAFHLGMNRAGVQ